MTINPYPSFNGTCEEAFKFYEQALGGKIVTMMKYEGSPMAAQVPPEWSTKIIHASINLGNVTLMGSDATPDRYQTPKGIQLSLGFTDTAEAERVFSALSESGTVHMPLAQTFWAKRFGMLTDRFGIPWMVNCE